MNGYIKLFRKLIDWEWYTDKNVKITFLHLLLTANFKPKQWKGNTILRGQLITSPKKLGDAVGLSIQQIRTVFRKLQSTGDITIKTTNKNTLVTIVNFECYQDTQHENNKQSNNQITNEQQTNNKQITTTEEGKKEKKVNNEKKYKYITPFLEVIKFYQSVTGQNIRVGKTEALIIRSDKFKKIESRLKAGATVEECKAVIAIKNEQWKNDKKMKGSINIPTLFRASNFEKYLDECDNITGQHTDTSNYTPPYDLPQFIDDAQRYRYFLLRFNHYRPLLPDQSAANTTLRQRAVQKQDAERLCYELEQQQPELSKIQFAFKI